MNSPAVSVTTRPWVMHQRWHDLLFAHWPVAAAPLREAIPRPLELDSFEGEHWVGIVPFWMSNVRPRGVPPVPGLSRFLELNVRTYVTHRGKPGVFFFSLDASNPVAVRLARALFHLPYFDARMSMSGGTWPDNPEPRDTGTIRYSSRRVHRGVPPAELRIDYRPSGPPDSSAAAGSLTHWLTARYCLYTTSRSGRLFCGDIHHVPWPLQPAEAEIISNTMARVSGIELPATPPLLHFSRVIDVRIWPLARCRI